MNASFPTSNRCSLKKKSSDIRINTFEILMSDFLFSQNL
ncbi:hypothetical protein ApDm4_0035 [Acetobacter pomorum]|nr:hypothetical protein ApDm4_0035 [Acetobacter pomorum]